MMHKKLLVSILILLSVLLVSCATTTPAPTETGYVTGKLIEDGSGDPLRGVEVKLMKVTGFNDSGQPALVVAQTVKSLEDGVFEFSGLGEGSYTVAVVIGGQEKPFRDDQGEILIFPLVQGGGIDLGDIPVVTD